MKQTDSEIDDQPWDAEIHGRMRTFVLNYCTSSIYFMNATRAYQEAYKRFGTDGTVIECTEESAASSASDLLRKPKVRRACAKLLAMNQPEADSANAYRLLHDLFLQATYDPADIIDESGNLKVKDLHELGDLAKCIEGLEPTKYGIKVRLASRRFAQDKLLKYYDLVREVPEIQASLPVIMLENRSADAETWEKEANGM